MLDNVRLNSRRHELAQWLISDRRYLMATFITRDLIRLTLIKR